MVLFPYYSVPINNGVGSVELFEASMALFSRSAAKEFAIIDQAPYSRLVTESSNGWKGYNEFKQNRQGRAVLKEYLNVLGLGPTSKNKY